jgi:hypothetical protein
MPNPSPLAGKLDQLFAEYRERVDHAMDTGRHDAIPKLRAMYDSAALELVSSYEHPQARIPEPRSADDPRKSLGRRALRRFSSSSLRD